MSLRLKGRKIRCQIRIVDFDTFGFEDG